MYVLFDRYSLKIYFLLSNLKKKKIFKFLKYLGIFNGIDI